MEMTRLLRAFVIHMYHCNKGNKSDMKVIAFLLIGDFSQRKEFASKGAKEFASKGANSFL